MSTNALTPERISRQLYRYDRTAEPLPSLESVADDRIRLFRQQGYLAVRSFLNEAEINDALDALSAIVFRGAGGARIQFTKPEAELRSDEERELAVRKVYEFVGQHPALHAIAHHESLIAALRRLMGENPVLVQDMALLKPPKGGGEKPWHQDMAYGPLAFDKPVVGAWIALDEAALDNGCMHVIPRSHMDGGMPHYAVRDWQVCDTSVPVERDVAVPLPPGGVLLFHGLLVHGTPFNLSEKRRRALQFHYAPESAVKLSPKEYKRMFTNEMTGAEC